MEYIIPRGGVSCIHWIDSISGDFLVSSQNHGILRIFNAANPNFKEIIRVSNHGIYDFIMINSEVSLIKLTNGQIIQFNIR